MDVFKRMVRDYEEQKKREYELANPCTYEEPFIARTFVWDGQTMCSDCCKHEYKKFVVDADGDLLCLLCLMSLGSVCRFPGPQVSHKRRIRKPRNPTIRVFDENGKRCRVRYWKQV